LTNAKIKLWKTIAITGFIVMTFVLIYQGYLMYTDENFLEKGENAILTPGIISVMNVLSWGAFLYLCFKPLTFNLYMFFALYYAFGDFLSGGNILGVLYSLLALLCAYKGGFFRRNGKIKFVLFLILLTASFLTQLRFGIKSTFVSFVNLSIVLMLTAAAILLLHDEIKNFIIANNNKVLKISQYTEITERDKVYLKSIFKGVKFETIAKENNISLGSLKNRMTEIYRIINVADKTELLIKYTDCE